MIVESMMDLLNPIYNNSYVLKIKLKKIFLVHLSGNDN